MKKTRLYPDLLLPVHVCLMYDLSGLVSYGEGWQRRMSRHKAGHTLETNVDTLFYLFIVLASFLPPFCNFYSVVAAFGFIPKIPELETRAQSSLGFHIPINAARTSVKT